MRLHCPKRLQVRIDRMGYRILSVCGRGRISRIVSLTGNVRPLVWNVRPGMRCSKIAVVTIIHRYDLVL